MPKPKPPLGDPKQFGRLLSTQQAAPLIGQEPETLRQWRHRRIGPPSFKSGGKVVWPEKPLMAWLARQYETTVRGDQ